MALNKETNEPSGAELLARVSALEEKISKKEKSIVGKFTLFVSLIALLVSITTGSIQILDEFYGEEQNKIKLKQEQAKEIASELKGKLLEFDEMKRRRSDEDMLPILTALQLDIRTLLHELNSLDEPVLQGLSAADLSLFSEIYITSNNLKMAKKFALQAKKNATSDTMRLDADVKVEEINIRSGDNDNTVQARSNLRSILERTRKTQSPSQLNDISIIYDRWIKAETSARNCEYARGLLSEMANFSNDQPSNSRPIIRLRAIHTWLAKQTTCHFNS